MKPVFLEAKVTCSADSEELKKLAKKKGIVLPSDHLGAFKTVYARIEDANRNDVRLSREAVKKALPSLLGSQININHWRQNWTCGSIFWAKINDNDEIEVAFTFFKDVYVKEFDIATALFEKGELTVSFELKANPDTIEFHDDGTRTLNDITFVGCGLLLDEDPAEPSAIVFEMAKRIVTNLIKNDTPELVYAKSAVLSCQDLLETINKALEEKQKKEKSLNILFSKVKSEDDITYDLAMNFYYASEEEKNTISEEAIKWTTKFINDLPDSAFAVIEPAYLKGETKDKRARHLPHHDGTGDLGKKKSNTNLDLPHLRNALARVNQIKSITDSISTEDLREKAVKHLNRHKDALEKANNNREEVSDINIDEDFEEGGNQMNKVVDKKLEDIQVKLEADEKVEADVEEKDESTVDKKEDKKVEKKDEKSTEDKSEESTKEKVEDKAEESTEEKADLKIVTETNKVVTETMDENSDTIEIDKTVKQTVIRDNEIVSETISEQSEKTTFTFAEVEAIKAEYEATIKTLEASLEGKDVEIEEAKEKAVKVEKLKAELGKYVKDFSDEDFDNEDKLENARLRKENDKLKSVKAEKSTEDKSEESTKEKVEDKAEESIEEDVVETASLNTGHVEKPVTKVSALVEITREKMRNSK